MKSREMLFPALRLEANFEPGTFDAKRRTVEMTWYAGARVQRFSLFDGPFTMSFSMEPKAVRLGRINSGAPLKGGHADNSNLSAVIGVIEKAWLSGNEGRAIARFSERADVEPIFQDVRDGILRNVSMEAVVYELKDVTAKGAEQKSYLATDWEPHAVALVAVGADPEAHALSESAKTFPCTVNTAPSGESGEARETRMSDATPIVEPTQTETPVILPPVALSENARKVNETIERDKERAAQIKRAATYYKLDDFWAEEQIAANTNIDRVMELAAEERNRRKPKGPKDHGYGDTMQSVGWRLEQMALATVARAKGQAPPETATQYSHRSLVELAYECLTFKGTHHGLDVRANGSRIVELALTSSDYPNLLANIASKFLLPDYEHATPTYRLLAERMDLPDFKTASVLKVGDFPIPLLVGEAGEIQLGAFSEAKDSYTLATYGRRLAFSFQSIVNDDLNAFQRVMRGAAIRLADFENGLWFTALQSAAGAGPTLGDTGALFNTVAVTTAGGHANLAGTAAAIGIDPLGIGRAAMKKQVSLDGLKLNIPARYLLTGPDKQTVAEQYTTQITPAQGSNVNPFAGTLQSIADANITSTTAWYLFADPNRAPISVYGYLQGMAGPDVATRVGFEVLGVEIRVALHFGFAFVDFRGAFRNAGV